MERVHVERSTIKYYLNRVHCLSSITDIEEKHNFILNTFLAFQKDGWSLALHPQVCRCLEELITDANVECIALLLKILSKGWGRLINSKFAYHLLHKALSKCQTAEYNADELIVDHIQSFCTHMKENLPVYITNSHATHTCRIYPQILAGVRLEKDKKTNTYKSAVQLVTPYDENYIQSLNELCKEFLFTKALKNHVVNEHLCPFIQVLLLVASARLPDVFTKKFKKVMKYSGLFSLNLQEDDLITRYLDSYAHPVATYFAELLVEVMPGANFAKFLNTHILSECSLSLDSNDSNPVTVADILMSNQTASRVLRAVIRRLVKPVDIKNFFTVIQSCKSNKFGIRSIIPNKQHGILTDLADLCIRHPSEEFQRTFLRMLPSIFGFTEKHSSSKSKEDLFIRCLVGMITLSELNEHITNQSVQEKDNNDDNQYFDNKEDLVNPVTVPGCLFVESLFKFTYAHPIKVINSLLSQSPKRLIAWAQHYQLSRVLEALILSESVISELKITLLKSLMNGFSVLACHPSVSHVVEALWTATNTLPQPIIYKELMAEQLINATNHLHSHKYGHFIYKKLSLELYKCNKTLWLTRNKSTQAINNKRLAVGKSQDIKRPRKSLK
uniref:Nucleolar protein 9 n=1 Tax=Schistosoma haematobium TaxID=6185 RepID=A0A095BYT1_SCHHA